MSEPGFMPGLREEGAQVDVTEFRTKGKRTRWRIKWWARPLYWIRRKPTSGWGYK
jgi:hypothetical protein